MTCLSEIDVLVPVEQTENTRNEGIKIRLSLSESLIRICMFLACTVLGSWVGLQSFWYHSMYVRFMEPKGRDQCSSYS